LELRERHFADVGKQVEIRKKEKRRKRSVDIVDMVVKAFRWLGF